MLRRLALRAGPDHRWRCARASASPFGERLAVDELEHEKPDLIRVLEAVNRADVRMIQRREHARFAIEAREPAGIAREGVRQHLDRHLAAELRVPGAVDLAHAADADERLHFVAAECLVDERRVRVSEAGRHVACMAGEPAFVGRRLAQQAFDLALQFFVGATRIGEIGRSIGRRQRARGVVQRFDLFPALRRHVRRRSFPVRARLLPGASRA